MKIKLIKDYKVHKKGSEYQTDEIEAQWLKDNGYVYMKPEISKAKNKMVDTRPRKIYKRNRKKKWH